jgi:acetyltransferase-like isoleucine patch superfamily enzyme
LSGLQRVLDRLSRLKTVEMILALIAYSLYAAVLGLGLAPSVLLVLAAFRRLVVPWLLSGGAVPIGGIVTFALVLAGSVYVFFFWGLVLMGSLVRLLSLGVRPGRHAEVSLVTLLWMILNGIFTLAYRVILPLVPMTFFAETFFRICGMRLGRGARINTFLVMDPYLVEIGAGSLIGGDAVLAPHVYEGGFLILEPIRIGANCLIGGHAFVAPGVVVGDGSTVGVHAYIRRGRKIPPHTVLSDLGGLDVRRIRELERHGFGRSHPQAPSGPPPGPAPTSGTSPSTAGRASPG